MKKLIFAILACATLLPAQTQKPLTNADIVQMVEAKLSDKVIVGEIHKSVCNFSTTPQDLIDLKKAGVSDAVLEVMTEAGRAESPAPNSSASPPAAAPAPAGLPAFPPSNPAQPVQPAPPAVPTANPSAFRLEDGTPIKLRLSRTISSADANVGDTVDFEVLEEVRLGDVVVIPKGSLALATVTEAQPKRRMARGGETERQHRFGSSRGWRKSGLARCQGGKRRGPYGGDDRGHGSDRNRVFSRSALVLVHAREGHHHTERH